MSDCRRIDASSADGTRAYPVANETRRDGALDTEDDMEIVSIPLLYVIPILVTWVVIYTAVLSALRRHDRD
jgi:hypothetical protein